MSIDDQILIGTSHDYRSVFKTYLEGLDTDVNIVEEPYYIRADDTRWSGGAHATWERFISHFEAVVNFRPTMSMHFCLRKTEITSMRAKLVYALFPLIQNLGCKIAYVQDYYEVILRYKEGQLEIKTQTHFWQDNDLEKIPLPYIELPNLFF